MPKQDLKGGLSSGRPPLAQHLKRSLPSKATRAIIRTHHQLNKELAQAIKSGDKGKAEALHREIEKRGGLKTYQVASITGQSLARGGDSSKVLMQWLQKYELRRKNDRLRMLEVGALSTSNACSRSGLFDMTWIDLNSQDPKIQQQDFMKRPLPVSEAESFDIISLSLVINYVPEPEARGDMLRRTCNFLRFSLERILPLLFFVLPAPCITNSRYLSERRLEDIMDSLGFKKLEQKISAKLYYSLWVLSPRVETKARSFPKVEVNPGRTRNNFSIVLH
ncbi:uncharacterized protein PV09_07747 [Verruconis gallopava]|uniref:25S rRNA adenine-N(1) methyltransferase n=1 Tax=Verruconis gallopava TaxID=253628 RepID=A0A0D1XEY1_9PEZI|nr:uncharacterized protein PV09_07747 [Verruconis gallopava]KIW00766.1 hypothetical protein PV09_07747 [Verruconis gallopava]